jgi:hypothetical protein
MDQRRFSTMKDVHRLEPMSASPGSGTVSAAWERFVQGEDQVSGVRPLVAMRDNRMVLLRLPEVSFAEGELFLVVDDRTNAMVPVSRRNAPAVRRPGHLSSQHNPCSREDSRV